MACVHWLRENGPKNEIFLSANWKICSVIMALKCQRVRASSLAATMLTFFSVLPNVFVLRACVWRSIFFCYTYCFETIKFKWNIAKRKISICAFENYSFSFIWCNSFPRFVHMFYCNIVIWREGEEKKRQSHTKFSNVDEKRYLSVQLALKRFVRSFARLFVMSPLLKSSNILSVAQFVFILALFMYIFFPLSLFVFRIYATYTM